MTRGVPTQSFVATGNQTGDDRGLTIFLVSLDTMSTKAQPHFKSLHLFIITKQCLPQIHKALRCCYTRSQF
jgi:hypothetical protein